MRPIIFIIPNGYVRISSAARRAMDSLAIYALTDLYLKKDEGNLDIKHYFWDNNIFKIP